MSFGTLVLNVDSVQTDIYSCPILDILYSFRLCGKSKLSLNPGSHILKYV